MDGNHSKKPTYNYYYVVGTTTANNPDANKI